uniref:BED-type domain-containing protein n=1 Tax=Parascaris equorum TaxID=6256 RepID=A0A914REG9_PAREQ
MCKVCKKFPATGTCYTSRQLNVHVNRKESNSCHVGKDDEQKALVVNGITDEVVKEHKGVEHIMWEL